MSVPHGTNSLPNAGKGNVRAELSVYRAAIFTNIANIICEHRSFLPAEGTSPRRCLKGSCSVPRTHDILEGLSNEPQKGGTSVMRYEFNPLNKAMIGALQDCLLSARPR
jgi:hypothetical protein